MQLTWVVVASKACAVRNVKRGTNDLYKLQQLLPVYFLINILGSLKYSVKKH